MDTAAVRAKVNDHAERLSRQTAVDRKKAEAQDRAFVAESLTGGELSKKLARLHNPCRNRVFLIVLFAS